MPTYPRLDEDNGWLEPESEANIDETQPEFPYNNVTQTESGHLFELDDTPGRERIRLQHRTGTFQEVHSDGTEVHKIVGDGYEIVAKDKNVLISGTCNITINGDAIMTVRGNKYERIQGDYEQEIEGNFTQVVKKKANIICEDDMKIGVNPSLLGRLTINAGGELHVNADLRVNGVVSSKAVYAQGRIDAGSGVSAGPLGFVSLTGGLALGIPVAVPLSIYTLGTINSVISVNAPLGNFGLMESILMTDLVNTRIYSAHIHPSFKGPTGPPVPSMI